MSAINVNRNVTDPFYRYKMPRLIAKVEGKGNGIKTVVVNMTEIAKALNRPPLYPTKYFGCELGAQTSVDTKNERYIVNGAHDAEKLQDLLDGFIIKYLLCSKCENPETHLQVLPKKEKIIMRCMACGHLGTVDTVHRLSTYIVKNPPGDFHINNTAAAPIGSSQKMKSANGSKKLNGVSTVEARDDAVMAAAVATPTHAKKSGSVSHKEESVDDWSEDTSREAVQRRIEALSSGAKTLTLTDDLEKSSEERLQIFFDYVKGQVASGHPSQKDILNESERLEVGDKAVFVLAELLFNQNMAAQIKDATPLLSRFTEGNRKAQTYILGAFEMLVSSYPDALMPKICHILKGLYDSDLVEEETILAWHEKPSKRYVKREMAMRIRDQSKLFIEWLKSAEEESDSEDDDDDVEVGFNAGSEGLHATKVTTAPKPAETEINSGSDSIEKEGTDEADGEEVDIDLI